MLRPFVLAAALALAAAPSLAAGAAGDLGDNVDMPFLIAPMSKDGKLLGYAYIAPKLVASSRSSALVIRDKIAFIQDAFVRDVNAMPVAKTNDATAVDTRLLADRLIADARRVVGAARVERIIFGDGNKDTGVSFAPLHPVQTPLRAGLEDQLPPQPAPAAAPSPAQAAAAPNGPH